MLAAGPGPAPTSCRFDGPGQVALKHATPRPLLPPTRGGWALSALPPSLKLPLDRPPPPQTSLAAGTYECCGLGCTPSLLYSNTCPCSSLFFGLPIICPLYNIWSNIRILNADKDLPTPPSPGAGLLGVRLFKFPCDTLPCEALSFRGLPREEGPPVVRVFLLQASSVRGSSLEGSSV